VLEAAISLSTLGATPVSIVRMRELCTLDSPDGRVYCVRVTCPGSANVNIFGEMPEGSAACRKVMSFLRRSLPHTWEEESIVLCNFPCFIVPACGAVITAKGRPVLESLYPTAGGEKNYQRILGVHSNTSEILELLTAAPHLDSEKPFAGYFSRWSSVYFHMVSESVVQDDIMERTSIRPLVQYVVPKHLSATQRKLLDFSQPDFVATDCDIIHVPRALFCTVASRHAAISLSFRNSVESLRLALHEHEDSLRHVASPVRLFVARGSGAQRPMENETEICGFFEKYGYAVVQPGNLTLLEQVKQFSKAAVVVGAHGAGLMNAAFAQPNAIVYELRALNREGEPGFGNESYRKVSAIMGHRYGVSVVENQVDSDRWTLAPDQLIPILQAINATG
jgi:capsular polysaccharide biosynthesis protein